MTRPPHGPKVEAAQIQNGNFTKLETTNRRGNVVKNSKKRRKSSQFQGIHDFLGYRGQYNLPTVIPLAISLPDEQSPESGAGHIFQIAQIKDNFELAIVIKRLDGFRQVGGSVAVYLALKTEQVTMFILLRRDFHMASVLGW
jgi:hypothetical protein